MNERVIYWVDISEYDLETAQAMLITGRYLYVGFMCHQSIEKILKALWQKEKDSHPPKTHNLSYLARELNIDSNLTPEILDLIDELEPLQIETRYPTYKEKLFRSLTADYTTDLLNRTGAFHQWIKQKL